MDLKKRKSIINIPRFYPGKDDELYYRGVYDMDEHNIYNIHRRPAVGQAYPATSNNYTLPLSEYITSPIEDYNIPQNYSSPYQIDWRSSIAKPGNQQLYQDYVDIINGVPQSSKDIVPSKSPLHQPTGLTDAVRDINTKMSEDLGGLQSYTPKENTSLAGKREGGNVNAMGIAQGASGMLGSFMNQMAAVKSRDELLSDAGTSNGNVMGINYRTQNNIDGRGARKELDQQGLGNTLSSAASGAQLGGSIVPGLGHAIGAVGGAIVGLFGWGASKRKLRKRIDNAQQLANRRNIFNRSGAMTEGLGQKYYSDYGDSSSGLLYANKGKDLKQPK